jgi:hypothetical protein
MFCKIVENILLCYGMSDKEYIIYNDVTRTLVFTGHLDKLISYKKYVIKVAPFIDVVFNKVDKESMNVKIYGAPNDIRVVNNSIIALSLSYHLTKGSTTLNIACVDNQVNKVVYRAGNLVVSKPILCEFPRLRVVKNTVTCCDDKKCDSKVICCDTLCDNKKYDSDVICCDKEECTKPRCDIVRKNKDIVCDNSEQEIINLYNIISSFTSPFKKIQYIKNLQDYSNIMKLQSCADYITKTSCNECKKLTFCFLQTNTNKLLCLNCIVS